MLENDKKANQNLKEELLKKDLNVIDGYDVSGDKTALGRINRSTSKKSLNI